jgi:hypothetical protein
MGRGAAPREALPAGVRILQGGPAPALLPERRWPRRSSLRLRILLATAID